MTTVLTNIQQVTPDWLTNLLRQKGFQHENRVIDVQITASNATNISEVYFLQVSYLLAATDAPHRLFVKLPKSDTDWVDKEIEFYTLIAPAMIQAWADQKPLFPKYYDVSYVSETNHSHLILEDLSETHFTNQGRMPPSIRLSELVIDAYAYFHGFWWEHAWLGQRVGTLLTEAAIDRAIETAQAKLANLISTVGSEIKPAQYDILNTVVSGWPIRRRQRVIAGVGVTLVHRDPHPLNFLYPYDSENNTVKLIDWQSWRVDTGTDDLAYLMACHWPLEEIERVEQALVQRYHRQLIEQGVQQYSWEDCQYDYRASIVRCLFFLMVAWSPTQWARGVWWDRIQHCLAAFERWRCANLFIA